MSVQEHRQEAFQFSIQKGVSFSKVKEIKALRGGVLMYAAQATPKIDAEIGKNGPFWTETKLSGNVAKERECLHG